MRRSLSQSDVLRGLSFAFARHFSRQAGATTGAECTSSAARCAGRSLALSLTVFVHSLCTVIRPTPRWSPAWRLTTVRTTASARRSPARTGRGKSLVAPQRRTTERRRDGSVAETGTIARTGRTRIVMRTGERRSDETRTGEGGREAAARGAAGHAAGADLGTGELTIPQGPRSLGAPRL